MIHVEPLVLIARAFDRGKDYGDEYRAVMTISVIGSVAHCSGLKGKLTSRDYVQMMDALAGYGITELSTVRHGKKKVYTVE